MKIQQYWFSRRTGKFFFEGQFSVTGRCFCQNQNIVFRLVIYLSILCNCPANIYLFKVNNRNTRKRCEISLKIAINTSESRQRRRSGVLILNFEHLSSIFLVFLVDFEQGNVSCVKPLNIFMEFGRLKKILSKRERRSCFSRQNLLSPIRIQKSILRNIRNL